MRQKSLAHTCNLQAAECEMVVGWPDFWGLFGGRMRTCRRNEPILGRWEDAHPPAALTFEVEQRRSKKRGSLDTYLCMRTVGRLR